MGYANNREILKCLSRSPLIVVLDAMPPTMCAKIQTNTTLWSSF